MVVLGTPRNNEFVFDGLNNISGIFIYEIPGDPKKGIPLFEIFWEAWVLTKLPTKLIFRFLIKSLAYFDKYFQRFF